MDAEEELQAHVRKTVLSEEAEVDYGRSGAIFQKRGESCSQQHPHMDFRLGEGLCSVIVAVGKGVLLMVGGSMNSDKEVHEVALEKGEMLVLSPNCLHGGAGYGPPSEDDNGNIRLHMYVHCKDRVDEDDTTTIHYQECCSKDYDGSACNCSDYEPPSLRKSDSQPLSKKGRKKGGGSKKGGGKGRFKKGKKGDGSKKGSAKRGGGGGGEGSDATLLYCNLGQNRSATVALALALRHLAGTGTSSSEMKKLIQRRLLGATGHAGMSNEIAVQM